MRPNFFLSLRVENAEVLQRVDELQRRVATKFPALTPLFVESSSLHITLFPLNLPNEEAIATAQQVLLESSDTMADYFNAPASVMFAGLDAFYSYRKSTASLRVLFLRLEPGHQADCLIAFSCVLYERFRAAGIFCGELSTLVGGENEVGEAARHEEDRERFQLHPHATVLKLSKARDVVDRENSKKGKKAVHGFVQDEL